MEVKGCPEKESFYVPNVDETMSDLGINGFLGLDDAIKKTIHWYESK